MSSAQQSRRAQVDFAHLQVASLERYASKYRLPGGSPNELLAHVHKHFSAQQFVMDEEEVLINFIRALRSNPVRPTAAIANHGNKQPASAGASPAPSSVQQRAAGSPAPTSHRAAAGSPAPVSMHRTAGSPAPNHSHRATGSPAPIIHRATGSPAPAMHRAAGGASYYTAASHRAPHVPMGGFSLSVGPIAMRR